MIRGLRFLEGLFNRADHVRPAQADGHISPADHLEALDRFLQRNVFAGEPVNTSATKNGWDRKRWILRARTTAVCLSEPVRPYQNRNDVSQFPCNAEWSAERRVQCCSALHPPPADRADGKWSPADPRPGRYPAAMSRDSTTVGIEVEEGGRRGRIGQVIRRHIHGLDGGDRARFGGR